MGRAATFAITLGLALLWRAEARACDPPPEPQPGDAVVTSPGRDGVGLAVFLRQFDRTADLVVTRSGTAVPVEGETFTLDGVPLDFYGNEGYPGVYVLFVPATPLDSGVEYDAYLVLSGADGEPEQSRTATFEPVALPAGDPFDSVSTDLRVRYVRQDEACCWETDDSCGNATLCVPGKQWTYAVLRFVFDTGSNGGLPRYLFRIDGGPLTVKSRRKNFAVVADDYCADLGILDVKTGIETVRRFCEPPDPQVEYGQNEINPGEFSYPRTECLGPPSIDDCYQDRPDDPGLCPGASAAITDAWCSYNLACRETPDDPYCRYYDFYCGPAEPTPPTEPDPDPEPAPEPPPSTGGCAASSPTGGPWLLTVATLIALAARRRRP